MKTISVEDDLLKLKELLQPLIKGFSEGKKSYINAILMRLITEINFRDNKFVAFQAKVHGYKDQTEFLDNYEMYGDLFALMGGTELDFIQLRKDCIDWMLNHAQELTRPFGFKELLNVHEHLALYRMIEERWPENFKELKNYITEFVNQ